METKHNDSTQQRPKGERIVDDKLVGIDLPAFIKKLREESTWRDSDRNAITVFKTDGLRIVLIGLHAGAEMARHAADGIISAHVLEGSIVFSTDDRSLTLGAGQVGALHQLIPHTVKAEADSFFLLTLTTKPGDQSVNNIAVQAGATPEPEEDDFIL